MNLKTYLKRSFRAFVSLTILMWIFPGFQVSGGPTTLIVAALLLTAMNIIVRPILKLLLLPLNLISFGMFRWVIAVVNLLLLALILEKIQFVAFDFPGFNQYGFVVPAVSFSSLASLIVSSFLLTIIRKIIFWFLRAD